MLNSKTVLVVAAHPDDEMLGCAGTLARLRSAGASITILLLGEGPTARSRGTETAKVQREASKAAKASAAVLGINDIRFASLPDNRFDTVPFLDIVQSIEKVLAEVKPSLVLTHFAGDLNIDHQLTARAVITACRPLPESGTKTILGFEVLSSTEYSPAGLSYSFHPSLYVDITPHLDDKQRALAKYADEMREWPHPRSHEAVEHLARLRGSQCGLSAAEAFVIYRHVM